MLSGEGKMAEDYPRFHLAIPVSDLEESRKFYVENLGCTVGRTSDKWIDFDFFGHQLTKHLCPSEVRKAENNMVDKIEVPVRHFGIVANWEQWHLIAERLKEKNIKFEIDPYIRFEGKIGEQATMFFLDPSGNALEIKAFQDSEQLFAAKAL